ncbi:hypothetical protein E4U21_005729 [Claviceps maximensis]|nr:hypothetical protein E4U21_005729 [Claviceps maximensis]
MAGHHQNTPYPFHVAGMAGGNHHHPYQNPNNNNHNMSWFDDAQRRWLAAVSASPGGGQSAWPKPQHGFPYQQGAAGQPAGPFTKGEDGAQDSKDAVTQGVTASDQDPQSSTPASSPPLPLPPANKEAHEAWTASFQKTWGSENPRHPGGHHFSPHGPFSRPFPGRWGWGGGAPWSAAGGVPGGPRWTRPHLPYNSSPKEAHDDDANKITFAPDLDVFETPERFYVHASLPGAKKEDIKVSWDPNTYELGIEGVISRPGGDEELPAKTMTVGERQIGSFRRNVYLGSHVDSEKVNAGGLTAVMEDGVLVINVPSQEHDEKEIKHITVA